MPTALVTGASSGIGAELARALARRGHDLVLTARREDRLRALAEELRVAHGVDVRVLPADLADPAGPAALLEALRAEGLEVDVLVNDAGFASYGPFAEVPAEDDLAQLRVNVVALTELTKGLLPPMLRRGRGGILNVASTAAFQPGPRMAVYYASKAYVLQLGEALAEETRGSGVAVTTLCPGPTRSGFQARAGMGEARLMRATAGVMLDARRVAEEGVRALERGQVVFVPGLLHRVGTLLARIAPRRLTTRAIARLNAPERG